VLITVANKYNQTFSKEKQELLTATGRAQALEHLLMLFGEGCDKKASSALKSIQRVYKGSVKPAFVFTNPCGQFEQILDAVRDMLSMVLSFEGGHCIEKNDIYASLAFKLNFDDQEWQFADVNKQRGANIAELLQEQSKSTLKYLIDSNDPYIFFNSKEEARELGRYLPDAEDRKLLNKLTGSIACYKINAKRGDVNYVSAVLCFSTYDKRFADEQDIETTKYNMLNFIVAQFEKRIRVELLNYCMYKLYEGKQAASEQSDKL
jgi:hypothetical protein